MKHFLKNVKKTALCMALALPLALSSVACAGTAGGGGGLTGQEKPDESRTYIYVQTYQGGFGRAWLDEIDAKFEEEYKNWVNPANDKKGVQVIVVQDGTIGSTFSDSYDALPYDVYMTESVMDYHGLQSSNKLMDLTPYVTKKLDSQRNEEGEKQSIVDLLNKDVKDYLNVSDKYYALPYESTFGGMYYDSELFFNMGLYLTKAYDDKVGNNEGATIVSGDVITPVAQADVASYDEYVSIQNIGGQDYTVTKKGEKLSMGPDGTYGTYDDGLPATYTEFFNLAEYMYNEKDMAPFGFSGKYANTYAFYPLTQLMADFEGYEQAVLDYTQNGIKTNVVAEGLQNREIGDFSAIQGGTKILNPNGDKEDNALVYRSLGKYYALKFYEKMLSYGYGPKNAKGEYEKNFGQVGGGYFGSDVIFNGSHLDAQEAFLKSKALADGDEKDGDITEIIGFHLDGIWWENESKINGKYNALAKLYGDNYKVENRRIKLLANPKVNMDIVKNGTHKATFMDCQQPLVLAKNNMANEKKEVAGMFIQYAFTKEANIAYTLNTGIPRPYDYDLTEEQMNSLTTYQRSIWDAAKVNGSVVFPWSNTAYGILNASKIGPGGEFNTKVEGFSYERQIYAAFTSHHYTAEQAFNGLLLFKNDQLS